MTQAEKHHFDMDLEARTMADMFENGRWSECSAQEQAIIRWRIGELWAATVAGARIAPAYWNQRLREIDECLRVRWCLVNQSWLVERWVWQWKAWAIIKIWKDDNGAQPLDIDFLCFILRKNDMQRDPGLWKKRRDEAAKIRAMREKQATDAVLAAVDSLSEKSIKQFVEVERAVQTGETINAHGQDFNIIDRIRREGPKKPDIPRGKSMNPGMHPRVLRRERRNSKGEPEQ